MDLLIVRNPWSQMNQGLSWKIKQRIFTTTPYFLDYMRLSNLILDTILPLIIINLSFKLWCNTNEGIHWFKSWKYREITRLYNLIWSYYSSISPILPSKSLIFAKRLFIVSRDKINIVILARKTIIEFECKLFLILILLWDLWLSPDYWFSWCLSLKVGVWIKYIIIIRVIRIEIPFITDFNKLEDD